VELRKGSPICRLGGSGVGDARRKGGQELSTRKMRSTPPSGEKKRIKNLSPHVKIFYLSASAGG